VEVGLSKVSPIDGFILCHLVMRKVGRLEVLVEIEGGVEEEDVEGTKLTNHVEKCILIGLFRGEELCEDGGDVHWEGGGCGGVWMGEDGVELMCVIGL
jgi:hypothetical protein